MVPDENSTCIGKNLLQLHTVALLLLLQQTYALHGFCNNIFLCITHCLCLIFPAIYMESKLCEFTQDFQNSACLVGFFKKIFFLDVSRVWLNPQKSFTYNDLEHAAISFLFLYTKENYFHDCRVARIEPHPTLNHSPKAETGLCHVDLLLHAPLSG